PSGNVDPASVNPSDRHSMVFVFSFSTTCAWLSDRSEGDSAAIPAAEQRLFDKGSLTLPSGTPDVEAVSLRKSLSIQNLTQIDTPWENVTLNRCLFVAITILVLTSGCQRLHEALRGQRMADEEEVGLTVRRSGTLRHRVQPPEPETSLWEVIFWWLPDFDDDDDEDEDDDDDEEAKKGKSNRRAAARASRGLRNRPQPDKKLMKQREGKLKGRRAKRDKDEEVKEKKKESVKRGNLRDAEEEENEDEKNEEEQEEIPAKNKKLEEKKERKKVHKA
ncbi:uncharacterized protein ACJ7VT_022509, partial [Polymixia lowei]